jgi:hypothetical protein
MRALHAAKVRRYRSALAYPTARVITLLADIGGVATQFRDTQYLEALLDENRAMHSDVHHHLRYQARDDRLSPDFWGNYLRLIELQVLRLQAECGSASAHSSEEVAVFPLHHTPTLVLAGRVIGEARPVRVFQYDRDRKTWQWSQGADPLPPKTFTLTELPQQQAEEVLLTFELTAPVSPDSLPDRLAESTSRGDMPWLRIKASNPSPNCLQRRDDLEQFAHAARGAINHVQDVMRARTVHVIAVSPASSVFRFGQMLQAGHHATCVLYDRPSRSNKFIEAFSINGHEVISGTGSQHVSIKIR